MSARIYLHWLFVWILLIITRIWLSDCVEISYVNYTCNDGSVIPIEKFCDGIEDCDGSDEIVTSDTCNGCKENMISCKTSSQPRRGCVIDRDYVCNGSVTCQGLDFCDVNCSSYYRCNDGVCAARSTICDGNPCHHNGCKEDDEWKNGPGFYCVRNGEMCKLPQQLLWDEVKDCDQGEDLCYLSSVRYDDSIDIRFLSTTTFDYLKCFQCLNGCMIVPRNKVCDDVFDCSDLSDECLCEGKVPDICKSVVQVKRKMLDKKRSENASCKIGQVQCSDGNCINRTSVCDSKGDCSDNLDEKFSYCRGTLLCKEALLVDSGTECRCYESCDLSVGIVCDNKGQCQPPVVGVEGKAGKWGVEPGFPIDECFNQCINITTFGCTVPFAKAYGTPVQAFSCETYGSKRNKSDKYFTSYDSQQTCDGIVDCLVNGEDETYCPNRFSCLAGRLISIKLSKVCDGIVDCDDGKDESNTTCPDRFFCSSLGGALVSIPLNQTCDLYNNCDNSADEMNCTDGRFYCENKTPLFVRKEQTFDGHFDCSDYSDECPTQTEYRNEDIFSSRYQLIANPILRALVWIMGLGALIGNAIVIYGESKHLRQILEKGGRAPLRTNHILILNLAIADFLMGVYLIILGIAGAIFSGNFCLHRLNWLSSTTCTAMGVLVVLSSECSVFTMILLTSFRIFAVVKPFSASNSPKAITVLCVIAIAWIFSFLIALLPLSTQLEDIFVDKALLSDNLFFKNVVVKFDSAKTYLTKLISFDPSYSDIVNESFSQIKDAGTWLDLQRIVYGTNQTRYLEFTRYFGYYSADAVCIPRFFVMKNEKTWKYSLSLAIINFLSFVYVASGYCFIIWFRLRTTKKNKETLHVQNADKQNAEMQKKIVRLVVTDFCCWVPISIMAFINFSGFKVQEIAYAISAIVLLPINSALNPLLYSDILDKLFSKIKSKFFEKSETSSVPNSSSDRTQPTLSSRSKR